PTAPARRTYVWFDNPTAPYDDVYPVTNNPYSVQTYFYGGKARGDVSAIQFTTDAGVPVAYNGFGQLKDVVVDAGSAVTGKSFSLAAVSSAVISGSVVVPS